MHNKPLWQTCNNLRDTRILNNTNIIKISLTLGHTLSSICALPSVSPPQRRTVLLVWPLCFSSTLPGQTQLPFSSKMLMPSKAMVCRGPIDLLRELNVGKCYARVGSPIAQMERGHIVRCMDYQAKRPPLSLHTDSRPRWMFLRIRLSSSARFPIGKQWSAKDKRVCNWELFPKTAPLLIKRSSPLIKKV